MPRPRYTPSSSGSHPAPSSGPDIPSHQLRRPRCLKLFCSQEDNQKWLKGVKYIYMFLAVLLLLFFLFLFLEKWEQSSLNAGLVVNGGADMSAELKSLPDILDFSFRSL